MSEGLKEKVKAIFFPLEATVRFQRNYHGKQPGDPAKAAAAILHIVSLSEPPLRLLLGSDAYNGAEKQAVQILASD